MNITFIPTPEEKPEFEELCLKMNTLMEECGLFGHALIPLSSGRKVLFRVDHSQTKGINNSHILKSVEPYDE